MKTINKTELKEIAKKLGLKYIQSRNSLENSTGTFAFYLRSGFSTSYDWWVLSDLVLGEYLLINTYRYSNSTSKHIYLVQDIIRELKTRGLLEVKIIDLDIGNINFIKKLDRYSFKEVESETKSKVKELELKLSKARKDHVKESYRSTITSLESSLTILSDIVESIDFNMALTRNPNGFIKNKGLVNASA